MCNFNNFNQTAQEKVQKSPSFAAVYNKMFGVIASLNNDADAEKLKDAMLGADAKIQHYLAKLIDTNCWRAIFHDYESRWKARDCLLLFYLYCEVQCLAIFLYFLSYYFVNTNLFCNFTI